MVYPIGTNPELRGAPPGALRWLALEKIRDGNLSCDDPQQMHGREGTNHPCSLCDILIAAGQIEYEVQCGGGAVLLFHVDCYLAWEEVRLSGFGE